MCGIVGVAGNLNTKEKRAFEDMLIFSQVRGKDSTGVLGVSRLDEFKIAKVVGRPDVLFDHKSYDNAVNVNQKMILGHNRAATAGKINTRNAHPFAFEHISGCHNGTVQDMFLRNLVVDASSFGTDSEAILANINEEGIEKTISKLHGAWALVWFDRDQNTLNFARNDQRDLFYCYSKDRRVMFWSSEVGFLKAALERPLNYLEHSEIYDVTPDIHYSWKVPKWTDEFGSPQKLKLKALEVAVTSHFPAAKGIGHNSGRSGAADTELAKRLRGSAKIIDLRSGTATVVHTATVPQFREAVQPQLIPQDQLPKYTDPVLANQVKDFTHHKDIEGLDGQGYMKNGKHPGRGPQLYRGFRNELLTKEQFEERTKDGCAFCGADAEWGKPVRFVDKDSHICFVCNGDPATPISATK